MYLSDLLSYVSNYKITDDLSFGLKIDKDRNMMLPNTGLNFALHSAHRILDEYDLYTMERSALLAASDISVDSPDKIAKLSQFLFEKPRQIFIECNYSDRKAAFDHMKIFERPENVGQIEIGDPVRIGFIVDSFGNGKASIQLCWSTPKSTIKNIFTKDMLKQLNIHKSNNKFFENLLCFNVSIGIFEVDINNITNITFDEFVSSYQSKNNSDISNFIDIVLHEEINKRSDFKTVIKDTDNDLKRLKQIWELYCLNSLASVSFPQENLEQLEYNLQAGSTEHERKRILAEKRGDLDGELIYLVALLALLEVDTLDISYREARKISVNKKKGFKIKAKNFETLHVPKLAVCTLDLGKGIEKELISNNSKNTKSDTGDRKTPTLHLVRGHLFLARNGKMVYRKPHWRGTPSTDKKLTKVRV